MLTTRKASATPSEGAPIDQVRRATVLMVGASLLAGSALPAQASAQHAGHGAAPAAGEGLAATAQKCVSEGESCLAHCFATFKAGDLTLAACAVAVDEAIAACNAMAKLALNGSAHAKRMATACRGICQDCEKECEKHSQHPACSAMAAACKATVAECDKLLA